MGSAMQETLDRLKQGVRNFQRETYPRYAERYRHAAEEPQRPHTLIITCADSRIDMARITDTGPGELFTLRNVGNLVPEYSEMDGGVSAAIEYAVSALKVQHIVICGHSDCGAIKALRNPETLTGLPVVRRWLRHAHAAAAETMTPGEETPNEETPGGSLRRLTEQNVLLQMRRLKTHPSVAEAMTRGELTASGWIYEIGSGRVYVAKDGAEVFDLVTIEDVPPLPGHEADEAAP